MYFSIVFPASDLHLFPFLFPIFHCAVYPLHPYCHPSLWINHRIINHVVHHKLLLKIWNVMLLWSKDSPMDFISSSLPYLVFLSVLDLHLCVNRTLHLLLLRYEKQDSEPLVPSKYILVFHVLPFHSCPKYNTLFSFHPYL